MIMTMNMTMTTNVTPRHDLMETIKKSEEGKWTTIARTMACCSSQNEDEVNDYKMIRMIVPMMMMMMASCSSQNYEEMDKNKDNDTNFYDNDNDNDTQAMIH